MKKSRFSDSQIINILKQAEAGTPVPELCREHGMGNATILQMTRQVQWYGRLDGHPVEEAEFENQT